MIGRGELEGRYDTVFYRPEIVAFIDRLNHGKYPVYTVRDISLKVVDGPFGTQLKVEDYRSEGIPVIRVSDVKTGEIPDEGLVRISPDKQRELKRSRVLPGDVILTKAGAILGYSAVFPERLVEGNITSHSVTIRCKNNINPSYLKHILKSTIGNKQIYRWGNKSTRPELNTGEVKRILIPVPDLDIQNEIVALMDSAHVSRKSKENDAQQLLASIDNYVLSQLGIQLPQPKENTLAERTFFTPFKKVTGSRFDPKKYSKFYQDLFAAVESCALDKAELRVLITHQASGDWGLDTKEVTNPNDYTECTVIRATEFDNQYNLNLRNDRIKLRCINNRKLGRMDVQEGDLLIEKSGGSDDQPVGRIGIIDTDILGVGNIAYSNFVHKIRIRDDVDSRYIFQFLKTMHNNKLTDAMQSQTNGIRNLIMSEYLHQLIPLPLRSKQEEIAEHVADIRARAKSLQLEAAQEIEEAKAKVERMILGE